MNMTVSYYKRTNTKVPRSGKGARLVKTYMYSVNKEIDSTIIKQKKAHAAYHLLNTLRRLNLIHIHSMHIVRLDNNTNHSYDYVIQVQTPEHTEDLII